MARNNQNGYEDPENENFREYQPEYAPTEEQSIDNESVPQSAATQRWSYHLANDPFGGAVGEWAKQFYDNPNIDPGEALQRQISGFRSRYGADSPEDDMSVLQYIVSGRAPERNTSRSANDLPSFPTLPLPGTPSIPSAPTPSGPDPDVNKARNEELYRLLLERATQSREINPNDPIIRNQANAFTAADERARRQAIADLAEQGGQYRNIRGEKRMSAEAAGQRAGAFQAELMGRELTARRAEITQALQEMGSLLTSDQQLALQRELGLLDAAIRKQNADTDVSRLGIERDRVGVERGRLGLDAEDRASYWDWIRRGGRL